jgi:hypothetical protein
VFSLIALLATMLAAACASGTANPSRTSRDTIARAEVEATNVSNALELIQRLRPEFLRPRTAGSGGTITPVVYVDGVRQGSTSSLQSIPKEIVFEVTYIDSNDATLRFGTGHGAGAVLISTRR